MKIINNILIRHKLKRTVSAIVMFFLFQWTLDAWNLNPCHQTRFRGSDPDLVDRDYSGGKVVQLPRSSHPSYTTSPDAGTGTDVGFARESTTVTLFCTVPTGTTQKLQRVQYNAARIVLQMPRRSHTKPLLHSLHWLPVDQRIIYKMAVVTFKVQSTATPAYLSRHLQPRNCVRNLRSSDTPLHAVSTFHQN